MFLFSLEIKVRFDYLAHSSKHICKTLIKKSVKYLLQNVSKIITKRGSFLITKRSKILLQNAAAFYNKTRQFYYKMRQVIQNASILLQNAAGVAKRVDFITKYSRCYETRHLLQNGA